MDIFLESIGICQSFREIPNTLNRLNLFCKGDAPSVEETKEEQAFAEIAGKKWQYYQDNFRPLENSYMEDIESLNTDGARDFASGVAASSTAASFDNARKELSFSLFKDGINPASGKFQSVMGGLSDAQGVAAAENKAMAENSVDDQYVGGVQNISSIGRGQSTTTQAGLSDLANSAAQKSANDAYNSFSRQASKANAAGSVLGLAAYELGGD